MPDIHSFLFKKMATAYERSLIPVDAWRDSFIRWTTGGSPYYYRYERNSGAYAARQDIAFSETLNTLYGLVSIDSAAIVAGARAAPRPWWSSAMGIPNNPTHAFLAAVARSFEAVCQALPPPVDAGDFSHAFVTTGGIPGLVIVITETEMDVRTTRVILVQLYERRNDTRMRLLMNTLAIKVGIGADDDDADETTIDPEFSIVRDADEAIGPINATSGDSYHALLEALYYRLFEIPNAQFSSQDLAGPVDDRISSWLSATTRRTAPLAWSYELLATKVAKDYLLALAVIRQQINRDLDRALQELDGVRTIEENRVAQILGRLRSSMLSAQRVLEWRGSFGADSPAQCHAWRREIFDEFWADVVAQHIRDEVENTRALLEKREKADRERRQVYDPTEEDIADLCG